jgi:hypothetical protein
MLRQRTHWEALPINLQAQESAIFLFVDKIEEQQG